MNRKLLGLAGMFGACVFSADLASAQCAGGTGAQTGLGAVSCSGVPAWTGQAVASGGTVTYNNCLYKANQAISANSGWAPGSAGVYLYGNGAACPTAGCNYGAEGTCGTATATPTTRPTATATATATSTARATATVSATPRATATATTRATATPTSTARATATSTATATATATTPPAGGTENFQAAFWTQGNDPCTNRNTGGNGEEWYPMGACSGTGCWAAWSATAIYNGGAQVSRNCGGTNPTPTATTPPRATATPTSTARATATATTGATPTAPPAGSRWLIGYWHNFNNGSGFIKLRDVSNNWDIIEVSFGEPSGTNGTIAFIPDAATSQAEIISDVQILHGRGKKVLLSIGGANGHVSLTSAAMATNFSNSVVNILNTYGFDGLDIDFEGQSFILNEGDTNFTNPSTPVLQYTIQALNQIHTAKPNVMLTMAPETFFVQLGYSFYGATCLGCDRRAGSYLPVINAVRSWLTVLQVQDYNSGSITGLDNQYHSMGGSDFHIKMTEMTLQGFPLAGMGGVRFEGLPPSKVAIGVPASTNAGNGYTSEADVQAAFTNLNGRFPGLKGIMSWSINWDAYSGFTFSNSHRAYLNRF